MDTRADEVPNFLDGEMIQPWHPFTEEALSLGMTSSDPSIPGCAPPVEMTLS